MSYISTKYSYLVSHWSLHHLSVNLFYLLGLWEIRVWGICSMFRWINVGESYGYVGTFHLCTDMVGWPEMASLSFTLVVLMWAGCRCLEVNSVWCRMHCIKMSECNVNLILLDELYLCIHAIPISLTSDLCYNKLIYSIKDSLSWTSFDSSTHQSKDWPEPF